MTITRRQILMGFCVGSAAAFVRRQPPCIATTLIVDGGVMPRGVDVLLVHDGGTAAAFLARDLRAVMFRNRLGESAVMVLTLQGFTSTRLLLERSRGKTLVSLLDDAESVVMEVLLKAGGADSLTRRRYRSQTLLTARL